MAGSGSILGRDKQAVIGCWEIHEKPCYSIWENSKEPAFTCSDPLEEDREARIVKDLDMIKTSGTTASFTIKFHEQPARGKINNTTPVIGSMGFRLTMPDEYMPAARGAAAQGPNMDILNQLFQSKMDLLEFKYMQKLEEKEAEIEELREELEAKDEDPVSPNADMGVIGRVLDYAERTPSIKGVFDKLLGSVADAIGDAITVGKYKMKASSQPINGVNDMGQETPHASTVTPDQELIQSLEIMRNWYVKEYGGQLPADANEQQKEEAFKRGFLQFSNDMKLLAGITSDDDMMHMALKKLRALA